MENIYNVPLPPIYNANSQLLKNYTFCGVDVETTGVDPLSDRIVSIACRKIVNGVVQEPKYFVVDPEIQIPPSASAIHGISNYSLSQMNAPTLDMIVDEVVDYIGDAIIVAHNAQFDRAFVNPSFFFENGYTRSKWVETEEDLEWKSSFNSKGRDWLCTYRLAYHLFKAHYGYSDMALSNEALRFWLEPKYIRKGDAHNALHDINTTLHNLMHILSYAEFTLGITTIEELFALQQQSIAPNELKFGKHRGEAIENVPTDYLEWCLNNADQFTLDYEVGVTFVTELKKRNETKTNFTDPLIHTQTLGSFFGSVDSSKQFEKQVKEAQDPMANISANNETIVPKAVTKTVNDRIKDVTRPQPKSTAVKRQPFNMFGKK